MIERVEEVPCVKLSIMHQFVSAQKVIPEMQSYHVHHLFNHINPRFMINSHHRIHAIDHHVVQIAVA